jgi:hypothetical protein
MKRKNLKSEQRKSIIIKGHYMKSVTLLLIFQIAVLGSSLSDTVATMGKGEWKILPTNNLSRDLIRVGSGVVTTFTNNLSYDPATGKILFLGGGHGAQWNFMIYDIASNTWDDAWNGTLDYPLACMGDATSPCADHAYDDGTVNIDSSIFYFVHRRDYCYRYDINQNKWTVISPFIPSDMSNRPGGATEYIPPFKGLLRYRDPGMHLYDLTAGSWSKIGGYTSGMHNSMVYNTKNQRVYFGGGNGPIQIMYEMDMSKNVVRIEDVPHGYDGVRANLFHDPITGDVLVRANDSLIYGFDIAGRYWSLVDPSPPIRYSGDGNVLSADLTDYGVQFFLVSEGGNNPRVYLYKHSIPADSLPITNVEILAPAASLEQYLTMQLDVVVTYGSTRRDTTCYGIHFVTLDTNIAAISSVSSPGLVLAKTTGTVKIIAQKRTVKDTIEIQIVHSTATLDSLAISREEMSILENDSFQLHVTGFYHKDNQTFQRNLDTLVTWFSAEAGTAEVTAGMVRGIAQGGPVAIAAEMGGVTDTAWFTILPRPSVIKRINFQVSDEPFSYGWLAENGQYYSSTRGFGWVKDSAGLPDRFIARAAGSAQAASDDKDNFLINSFVEPAGPRYDSGGNVIYGNDPVESEFRINVPNGEYIIRAGVGHYYKTGKTAYILYGTDTLIQHVSVSNNYTEIVTDTLTVTGGNGLSLTCFGSICYLVIISSEGIDIDLVALDDGRPVPISAVDTKPSVQPDENLGLFAYPNPFNPVVQIKVMGDARCEMLITLQAYDINGKLVADLTHHASRIRPNAYTWNASSRPSGVYIIKARLGKRIVHKHVTLIK